MGWELIAIAGAEPRIHRLPDAGTVVIGRGGAVDVVIDHPSISRRHALVHLEPSQAFLEDVGSANGSRIVSVVAGDAPTAQTLARNLDPGVRVALEPTSSVQLGSVVVLVRRRTEKALDDASVVAVSPAMKRVFDATARVAQAPLSVLLVGETGVGKDVVARAIHAASKRREGPFVAINCAALPEHLVESELFGHEKGAFTGAVQRKTGLLEAANGGTVFFDEIGELPLAQQSKLLRAVETRTVMRVGALEPRPVDVRFIAATNRDPQKDVEEGKLRQDLYFRLSGMPISIPPLRERPEDVVPLVELFAKAASKSLGRKTPRFAESAIAVLRGHSFPGNVRELRNVVERAVTFAEGVVEAKHLFLDATVVPSPKETGPKEMGKKASREGERERIVEALAACGGNQTRAAALLGISRRTLVSRLADFGIARPRARADED